MHNTVSLEMPESYHLPPLTDHGYKAAADGQLHINIGEGVSVPDKAHLSGEVQTPELGLDHHTLAEIIPQPDLSAKPARRGLGQLASDAYLRAGMRFGNVLGMVGGQVAKHRRLALGGLGVAIVGAVSARYGMAELSQHVGSAADHAHHLAGMNVADQIPAPSGNSKNHETILADELAKRRPVPPRNATPTPTPTGTETTPSPSASPTPSHSTPSASASPTPTGTGSPSPSGSPKPRGAPGTSPNVSPGSAQSKHGVGKY